MGNAPVDLAGLRHSSKRAAQMTLFSGLIVLGSLAFSAYQINSLDKELAAKHAESSKLDDQIKQKQDEIARLQANREQLNETIGLIPNADLQKAISGNEEVAKKLPPRIYIHIADETQRETAQAAAKRLRAAGFIVPGIEYVGRKSPNPTQLRYFAPNAEEGPDLKGILQTLKTNGVEVEPQYIPPADGQRGRPRHFELWFGQSAVKG